MYNSSGLVPARFLILICHFIICTITLWNKEESVRTCLPQAAATERSQEILLSQWVTGLSIMIAFICFEMLAFLLGVTMFNSTSALLSVSGHSCACIFLYGLILNGWQCGWFWWIFSFGTVLPFVYDIFVVADTLINKKY